MMLTQLTLSDHLATAVDAQDCHPPTISYTRTNQVMHRLAGHAELPGGGTVASQFQHEPSRAPFETIPFETISLVLLCFV